eukprot:scaffold505_cov245-Ochromonas_danica.AAC.1
MESFQRNDIVFLIHRQLQEFRLRLKVISREMTICSIKPKNMAKVRFITKSTSRVRLTTEGIRIGLSNGRRDKK